MFWGLFLYFFFSFQIETEQYWYSYKNFEDQVFSQTIFVFSSLYQESKGLILYIKKEK